MKKCESETKAGRPCPNYAQVDRPFCFVHDPERAADRAEARKLGGHNRRRRHATTPPPTVTLRSLADVLALLELVAADVMAMENSLSRAKVLVYLASTSTRSIELGELEQRLVALEQRAEGWRQ